MHSDHGTRGIHRFIAAAVFILGIAHWASLLTPPLAHLAGYDEVVRNARGQVISHTHVPAMTPGDVLISLAKLNSPIYPPDAGILDGPLFLILTVVAVIGVFWFIRGAFRYWDASMVPITILEGTFRLDFLDDEMREARFSRVQIMHANRRGASGYQSTSMADKPNAKIDLKSIAISSTIGGERITQPGPPEIFGDDRRIEVMEKFKRELPHHWYVSVLPLPVTRMLYRERFIQSPVVKRTGDVIYIDQHNQADAHVTLTSQHRTGILKLSISFPEHVAPDENDISFRLISRLVFREVGFETSFVGRNKIYSTEIRGFSSDALRARWKNDKLKEYLASKQC